MEPSFFMLVYADQISVPNDWEIFSGHLHSSKEEAIAELEEEAALFGIHPSLCVAKCWHMPVGKGRWDWRPLQIVYGQISELDLICN